MQLAATRIALCRLGRLLHQQGLVAGMDGNLSARIGADRFVATPTGCHLGLLEPDELVVINGDQVPARVTSEWAMHRACYDARSDVSAVVHAHPPHLVAQSLTPSPPDPSVLPEVLVGVGSVARVPYLTTGTESLAVAVGEAVTEHNAVVLQRHGAVTVGPSAMAAFSRMEAIEHAARILHLVRGPVEPLPPEERARLMTLGKALARP